MVTKLNLLRNALQVFIDQAKLNIIDAETKLELLKIEELQIKKNLFIEWKQYDIINYYITLFKHELMDYLDESNIKVINILKLQLTLKANSTQNKIIEYHKIVVMLKKQEYIIEQTKLEIMTTQSAISYQNQKEIADQEVKSIFAYKAYNIAVDYLNKQQIINCN
jgi:hypothetical protein